MKFEILSQKIIGVQIALRPNFGSVAALVILFVVIAAAVIVLELGAIFSFVRSIVLSKSFKPFM